MRSNDLLPTQAPFFSRLGEKNLDEIFPFGLGSDNHSGVHPRVLQSIANVNTGFAPSYGTDLVNAEAVEVFRRHFGPKTDVYFCFNGTAANVLSLAPLLDSHEAVICGEYAHLAVDECGAPERILGSKLHLVKTPVEAKLTPEAIEPFLIRGGDQHFAQPKLVSVTLPTELGTVYTRDELRKLVEFCRAKNLWLHLDGARLINATQFENSKLNELCEGFDVVSFGGTKNGLLFGEAVLFLTDRARERAKRFPYIRKQLMQLPSKTRFVAAQFVEFLGSDLWLEIAQTTCSSATRLRKGLEAAARSGSDIRFTQPTQANAVFAIFDRVLEKKLKSHAFFYNWDEHTREARLMTSWSTTNSDIDRFIEVAR